MITRFSRKGAATASAVLCMSLPAAFLALHTGCASNPSEYKNPSPAISVFTTGTISGTTFTPTPASSTLAIASGGSAWLRANFGMKDGSAVVTPGNIPVESNVPFQISNIPATTTYTLTVTSGDGQKATATCTVTVLATPSGLTYTNEDAAYYVGVQIPTNTPTVAGAAPITYTVSPSLPSGLSLNASTGEITGSPQAVTTQATYTVTATNTVGSTTRAIKIAVAATPIDLSISPTATGPGGSAILTWNANLVSGLFSAVTITATPADSSLGTSFSLSGTKNVGPLMLTTTYTLSATPAAGGPAVTKSVDITVGSAPVNITGFTATPSVTPMGGTSALAWTLTGTPLTLTLDGADAFGTSGKTVTPIRRQTYTLSGSNVLNVSPATANVEVAARGLDIVAGSYGSGRGAADGDPDPNGFSRARFYRINAIAVDPRDGAVIVADYQSSTIRRIGPDRKVRTIAGIMNVQGAAGANTDATKLSQPAKLAVDPDTGDVYVGGEYFTTRRLLKLTCTGVGTYTASVPTFTANAGTTLPTAPNSNAFAVNNGNFYWVDFNTKMLYKTNTTTYATDMILDTSATFSGAASMAADFNGGRKLLYVACTGVSGAFIAKVFKIDLSPATPTATLIAGGATQSYIDHATDATLGTLNNCSGIAVDTSGNLYIADQLNAAVRMVPAGGLFQNGLVTIAGKVPTVPTTPIKGYLNASQTLGTVLPTNADTQATLSQNYTVAVQGDGTAGTKIYVGDNTSGAADTQSVRLITVSGTTTNGYPGGGTVYTVDDPARPGYTFAGGPIVTGAVDGMGTLAQFNFALPAATSENTGANLAALPDGSMTFAADTKNNLVRIIAANGAVTTLKDSTSTNFAFLAPKGIAVQVNPTTKALIALFVGDTGATKKIRKFTPNVDGTFTEATFVVGGGTYPATPNIQGMTVDHVAGFIYATDFTAAKVFKIDATSGASTDFVTATGTGPVGIGLDGNGNVWVALQTANQVKKYDSVGAQSLVVGTGTAGYADNAATAAMFSKPNGLVVIGTTVYVTDFTNNALRAIATGDGAVTSIIGAPAVTGSASFTGLRPGLVKADNTSDASMLTGAIVRSPLGLTGTTKGDLLLTSGNSVYQVTAPPAQ